MSTLDPASMALRPDGLAEAVARINQRWSAMPGDDRTPYEPQHFFTRAGAPPGTLADLFGRYDYGEPRWNGSLMLLARELLIEPPGSITIASVEELPAVDADGILRFFHGDVACAGDLGVFESTWITGSLRVGGVLEASYLDAYTDLFVGGEARCEASMFMGLSLFGEALHVRRFAYAMSQGENWVLGAVRGPALIGEDESVADWDAAHVQAHIDTDDDDLAGLAERLGVPVEPEDEYAFSVVLRAFEAARATAPDAAD
jgi:hypothetical protein